MKKKYRHLTEPEIHAIAIRYKHRSDFARADRGAYAKAKALRCLDRVCRHMVRKTWRARKVLKLSARQRKARRKPKAWVYPELLHRTKPGCAAAAWKYSTRGAFRSRNDQAYESARRNGWLGDICGHMVSGRKPPEPDLWEVLDAAWSCKTTTEFRTKHRRLHEYARRRGWSEILFLERTQRPMTAAEVADAAQPYNTRTEFYAARPGAYGRARELDILDDVCAHMEIYTPPKRGSKWTADTLKAIGLQYATRHAFMLGHKTAYNKAHKLGLIDEVCAHMEPAERATDDDTIYIWRLIGQHISGRRLYKIGLTSAKLGLTRIHKCAVKNGYKYKVIALEQINGSARDVERQLLALGQPTPGLQGRDGYTEFRALTQLELDTALALIAEQAVGVAA